MSKYIDSKYKKIIKTFEYISGKYGKREVYCDFLEIAAISIRNQVDFIGWQKRENRYFELLDKYGKENFQKFAEILGELTILLNEDPADHLGNICGYLGLLDSKWRGQCFTPKHIAELLQRLTFEKETIDADIKRRGFITCLDPTVGGGSLLVASAKVMQEKGYNLNQILYYGSDIDIKCVYMSYIQLSLIGACAEIDHCDALSGKMIGEKWRTPGLYYNFFTFFDENGKLRKPTEAEKKIFYTERQITLDTLEEEGVELNVTSNNETREQVAM